MTDQMISALAGVLLSLLFSYVPGLSTWYEGLEGTYKRLVMRRCPDCPQASDCPLL